MSKHAPDGTATLARPRLRSRPLLACALLLAAIAGLGLPAALTWREHAAGERRIQTLLAADGFEALLAASEALADEAREAALDDPRFAAAAAAAFTRAQGPHRFEVLESLAVRQPDFVRGLLGLPALGEVVAGALRARVQELGDAAVDAPAIAAASMHLERLRRAGLAHSDLDALAARAAQMRERATAHAARDLLSALDALSVSAPAPGQGEPDPLAAPLTALALLAPQHPLLEGPRLVEELGAAVTSLATRGQFEDADTLIARGRALLSDPERLDPLVAHAAQLREQARAAAGHAQALTLLEARNPDPIDLESWQALGPALDALVRERPRDAVLRDRLWAHGQAFEAAFTALVREDRYEAAAGLLYGHAPLLAPDVIVRYRDALDQAPGAARAPPSPGRAEAAREVNALIAAPVLDPAWEARFVPAMKRYMASSPARAADVVQVREALGLLYRDQARATLRAGDATRAARDLLQARAWAPRTAGLPALAREVESGLDPARAGTR